ncbi:Transposon Ty3-G Gag-Pol polyprotein [Folsomia candida]|uniref:Transposon Ty3-G Gag-Pol polyprotein n=1 Tax=Folsomia candida TaxID=158441 RepID=A0A226CSV2_FOLCA|nr:Transposon Ty3-G Gag-Pol polyprotein [Folsomia candida]
MPGDLKLADVGDAAPIAVKPYPRSFAEQQFINEQVVLVRKPDNSWRFCVAYMKINAIAKSDPFPMSCMQDLFQIYMVQNGFLRQIFEMDFFYIPLPESEKKYTSFVTNEGQFEFEFVPMRAKNSPPLFLRVLNYVFKDMAFGAPNPPDKNSAPSPSHQPCSQTPKIILRLSARQNSGVHYYPEDSSPTLPNFLPLKTFSVPQNPNHCVHLLVYAPSTDVGSRLSPTFAVPFMPFRVLICLLFGRKIVRKVSLRHLLTTAPVLAPSTYMHPLS